MKELFPSRGHHSHKRILVAQEGLAHPTGGEGGKQHCGAKKGASAV